MDLSPACLPCSAGAFLVAVLGVRLAGPARTGSARSARRAPARPPPVGVVVGPWRLVLVGLLATGRAWLRLMAASAHRTAAAGEGCATFFVGQLGKYIPGSVWSIGAQAQMAGRRSVPARATVAAGLLFLGYHVATAVCVGPPPCSSADWSRRGRPGSRCCCSSGRWSGLLPAVVRRAGRRVAGRAGGLGAARHRRRAGADGGRLGGVRRRRSCCSRPGHRPGATSPPSAAPSPWPTPSAS